MDATRSSRVPRQPSRNELLRGDRVSVFSKIIKAGLAVNRKIRGEAIVYRRGDIRLPILDAKLNANDRIEVQDGQAILQFDAVEWRIGRADLGELLQPRVNDRIEFTDADGVELEYAVFAPQDLRQCWRWTDNGHSEFSIFSKLFGKG